MKFTSTAGKDRYLVAGSARFLASTAGGLGVVGVFATGVFLLHGAGGPAAATLRTDVSPAAAPSQSAALATNMFSDGSYSAVGRYLTPGGNESIGLTLQVTHGVVADARVQTEATSPTALQFQRQFQTGFRAQVVGRPLEGLSVHAIAGASLTSLGFDNALAAIRSKARN